MIIQGSGMVHPTGLATSGVNQIWNDACIPAYALVADAVHNGGSVLFGQLSHLGRQGNTFAAHRELWAPSAVPDPASRVVPHAMTRREIVNLIEAYRKGANRYLRAGFDGIEVYLAHGYLLCEFMSGFSNRRTDEYGGSFENRLRLPVQVLQAVRDEIDADVPMGIRISADEFSPGGLDIGQSCEVVQHLLDVVELDFISVSQSNYASMETMIPDMSFPVMPFVHYASDIRRIARGVAVMAVGRVLTPARCEQILVDEIADFVLLVRPLIADPELPEKARTGRLDEIRECISCNVGCRGGPHRGLPIACLVNPAVGFEATLGTSAIGITTTPKRVMVIGGGPAGLKAAETGAVRGHSVHLFEASERLGGEVLLASSVMPYRDEFAGVVRHLEHQIERLTVRVHTGVLVSLGRVADFAPDVVLVATGARPGFPDIPGVDLPSVYTYDRAIAEGVNPDHARSFGVSGR